MPARKLTKREASDLVIGAKILACGGGGSEAKAIENIAQTYDNQNYFTISDLDDFNPDDHICIIGNVGGGITEEDQMLVEGLQIVDENPMITAVKELEEFLGIEFQGFVATELGPNNSVIPLMVAAQTNRIAIDGDCCGRSKPKISISTTRVAGISISPLSIVNHFGDVQIVKNTTNDIRGEIIAREAARISGGSVSVARCPMTIKQAQTAVITKTFSLAIELGNMVRNANENKTDPIESIKRILPEAKFIFSGKVEDFSRIEEGGFTSGEIILETSEKSKKQLRIWYQNEYLLSWLNNEHYVTCPDGFYVINSVTGHGLTPWEDDFKEGKEVTIFTRDAPQIWQSKKGLSVFGPKVFNKNWTAYKRASSYD